jgi:endo-1,4-beta-xylanase
MSCRRSLFWSIAGLALVVRSLSAVDTPLAQGKPKFLGSAHSGPQATNFLAYWNQVVPENAGKWGSVESTRDSMNWTELDTAYHLAKNNGLPFRYHILVWGNQQPTWIESLPQAEQLEEIQEWFAAVAQRYPGSIISKW